VVTTAEREVVPAEAEPGEGNELHEGGGRVAHLALDAERADQPERGRDTDRRPDPRQVRGEDAAAAEVQAEPALRTTQKGVGGVQVDDVDVVRAGAGERVQVEAVPLHQHAPVLALDAQPEAKGAALRLHVLAVAGEAEDGALDRALGDQRKPVLVDGCARRRGG
jgi:hypothetical protein